MRATLAILTVLVISACGGERVRPMAGDAGICDGTPAPAPSCDGEAVACAETWEAVCYSAPPDSVPTCRLGAMPLCCAGADCGFVRCDRPWCAADLGF